MRPYFALVARMISKRWPLPSVGREMTTRPRAAFAFHARGAAGRVAFPAFVGALVCFATVVTVVTPPPETGTAGGANSTAAPVAAAVGAVANMRPPQKR